MDSPEELEQKLLNRTIEKALGMEEDGGVGDWSPWVHEEAWDILTQAEEDVSRYCEIIDRYVGEDGTDSMTVDYDGADLVAERYNGDLIEALKSAAATCLGHSVLDDLEKLGI